MDDPSVERFVARRAAGWRQQGSTVILELEGTREPDHTDIAAILAGAPLNDALDRAELAVSVLESGTVRLVLSANGVPPTDRGFGLLAADDLEAAPLGVTTTEGGLHLASERHGGYGPDPEDVTIEVTLDPFGLTIIDAGGRPVVRLAAEGPDTVAQPDQHRPAPLAWIRRHTALGETERASTVSVTLEPDERLFGLGERAGPLNLVGTTQTTALLDAAAVPAHLPFLLSSRGYGLLVLTRAGLTADLGQTQPAEFTILTPEPELELLLFPSNWPRTAVSNATRLTGRADVPPIQAFGLSVTGGPAAELSHEQLRAANIPHESAHATALSSPSVSSGDTPAPNSVAEMQRLLQRGLTTGLASPELWRSSLGVASSDAAGGALSARWAQLALFGPLVSAPPLPADDRLLNIVRQYAELRYRLLPYLLHCTRESADSGLPMLRPLLLEHSWDPEAVDIDDQFLLGRDLLVAPVFSDSEEPATRRIYLPGYANWYDWWTGTLYDGQQWLQTTVPLDRLPLYVRAGTAVPLADARQTIGDGPVEVSRLLLFMPKESAIGASIELGEDELMGVEQERGDRKARCYLEGIPGTVRDLEIVGLPASATLVDASAPAIALTPSDGLLPGQGARWSSLTVRLDQGAFTAGLELGW